MTCNNISTCVNRKRHKQPVWYCEEFDNYSVPKDEWITIMNEEEFLGSKEKETNGLKGLCSNCANLKKCTFQKPEGGVWHCEEYM
jgi:hypothetical protein